MSPGPRETCEKLEKRFSRDLNYGNATTRNELCKQKDQRLTCKEEARHTRH